MSVLVPTLLVAQAGQQPTTEELRRNCLIAQQHLKLTLKQNDLKARVDRLQVYQYTLKRLDLFVARLDKHNQPYAQELRETATELRRSMDDFKSNYEVYDRAREHLSALSECQSNINEFKSRLNLAREKLALLQADVAKIDTILETDIEDKLEALLQELQADAEVVQ